jgi:hypothetical protein
LIIKIFKNKFFCEPGHLTQWKAANEAYEQDVAEIEEDFDDDGGGDGDDEGILRKIFLSWLGFF